MIRLSEDAILRQKFDYFNKKFFKKKLHVDKIGFSNKNSLSKAGEAILEACSLNNINYFIKINKNLKDEDYDNILIHEMIHLWQWQINKISRDHDALFENKAKEINNKYGYNIPIINDEIDTLSFLRYKKDLVDYVKNNYLKFNSIGEIMEMNNQLKYYNANLKILKSDNSNILIENY